MTEWQDNQFITKAEVHSMPREDQLLIESDPNKWQFEWETERYYNAHHPDNETWLLERQAAEARALLG